MPLSSDGICFVSLIPAAALIFFMFPRSYLYVRLLINHQLVTFFSENAFGFLGIFLFVSRPWLGCVF